MMIDFAAVISNGTKPGEVTGASFAYWDGETAHTAVGGLRNSVTGDPVTADTLMHIGSIAKVLNACLFLQLVDDGLVDLDDPVTKHLPKLKLGNPNAGGEITCRMLLNHTCGIDFDCPDYEDFDRQRIELAVSDCAEKPQLHPPGEATSYSNIGTVIAGFIAQELRGEGWYSLIKSRIFEPLGLDHSLVDITEVPRFRVSVGDQVDGQGNLIQSAKPFLPLGFAPAGATAMMTATDLVGFARALINGGVGANGTRILSETSAALMATETAAFASPPDWHVGLGWMILHGDILHHGGGGPGVNSALYAHPKSGRAFALLTNCSKQGAFDSALIDPILASWDAATNPPEPLEGKVDPSIYAGTFENQIFRYEIFSEGDRLLARFGFKIKLYESDGNADPVYELQRIGNHLFQMLLNGEPALCPIAFVNPDGTGKMQRLGTLARILNRVSPT